MYYFIDWKRGRGASEPDLPEGPGWLLLAEPCQKATWGLFACPFLEDDGGPLPSTVLPVPDRLAALLESAEGYPPALALARQHLGGRPIPTPPRSVFADELARLLRIHLGHQHASPFFMAEARVAAPGRRREGAFYWIIGYDPEAQTIRWVSNTYEIHRDPVEFFDVNEEHLDAIRTT